MLGQVSYYDNDLDRGVCVNVIKLFSPYEHTSLLHQQTPAISAVQLAKVQQLMWPKNNSREKNCLGNLCNVTLSP